MAFMISRSDRPRLRLPVLAVVTIIAAVVFASVAPGVATAATLGCPTASYGGKTYCVGTISDLNAGAYPAGTRVVLHQVIVDSGSGSTRTLSSMVATPCPPGRICGASIGWVYTTVDFGTVKSAPPLYYYADVYGTTTSARTLRPAGYVLGAYVGNPDFF